MSRVTEPFRISPRGADRPGEWLVWIRPATGLPEHVCDEWTRKSLSTAPPDFLIVNPWPKTQSAANRTVQALIEFLRDQEPPAPPREGPTLGEYAKLFWDAAKSPQARAMASEGDEYSPATLANYKGRIELHILTDKKLCALKMGDITWKDLEGFLQRLLAVTGRSRTFQDTWTILRMIFRRYAIDNACADPFAGKKKPGYQEEIRGALTEKEIVKLFLLPFPSPIDKAICSLAFWAGLRRGEVFALRWADVDFPGKKITISHAIKRFGEAKALQSEGGTKGRKARVVPAVDAVLEALKVLPKVDAYVISFPDGKRPGGIRNRGKRPGDYDWRNAMHGAFERAGIDAAGRKITPHSSRHSIASVLLSRGVPKDYIRKILGHFDERTTDGYLSMAADEIEKMGRKIETKKKLAK